MASDYLKKGDERRRKRDFEAAERWYQLALQSEPHSAHAMRGLGDIFYERRDMTTALMWAQKAVATDPNYALGYNLLGAILMNLKQFEPAVEALAKSPMNGSREKAIVHYQMALCEAALDHWAEAETYLRNALENEPSYVTRFHPVGIITHDPLYADCHFILAHVLGRVGKVEEGMLHGRLARKIDPTVSLSPEAEEILLGRSA